MVILDTDCLLKVETKLNFLCVYCVSMQKKYRDLPTHYLAPTTDSWHLTKAKSKKSEMFGPNVADKYASAVTKNLVWGVVFGCVLKVLCCSKYQSQIPIQYHYLNFLKMGTKLKKDLSRLCCLSFENQLNTIYFRLDFFELLMTLFHQFWMPKHLWLPH